MIEKLKFWMRIRWVKYQDDYYFWQAKHIVDRRVHNGSVGHYDHNGKYHR